MKTILAIAVALGLTACSLTPEERVAIGDGLRAAATTAVQRIYEMDPNTVSISADAKEWVLLGCDIALEEGNALFQTAVDILVARINTDPNTTNLVTGAEVIEHVRNVCGLVATLPETAPDVAPVPAPAPAT